MKRFCFLLLSSLAFGQGVILPPQQALKVVNGITSPVANATITVCAANASGIPCAPALVSAVFKDAALTQPLTNPFTSDANGNYVFAIAPGNYTVTVSAATFAGYSYQTTAPIAAGSNNTFTGATTFSGATNLNGGGSLTGTFSGNSTFTGASSICNLGPGVYIVGPSGCPNFSAQMSNAIAFGPGAKVMVVSNITIGSTATVGQNSPSHVPVTVEVERGAIITCSVTGTTDCFQLSSGSRFRCDAMLDGSYSQASIVLASTAVVRDVFRAISQDGSQESMGIEGCMVDGGSVAGATVVSVYNYSETFEGTFLHDFGATNFSAVAGGACGIKIFTVAAATDGAASIDISNGWIIPTGSNKWFCIDGTGNTGVNINRIGFRHVQFRANGTSTATMATITSGVNGQIKSIWFYATNFGAATISNQTFLTFNGCFYCVMDKAQFSFQSGSGDTGISLGNAANQQNFGNSFTGLGFAGAWGTNLLTDARGPTAGGAGPVNIAFNASGNFIENYTQDDGNTSACRFVIGGNCMVPPGVPFGPYNALFDVAAQSVGNKTFSSSNTFNGFTNGTGLQAFNTTTTCTTAATISTPCTTAAITLPVAYADTNYRIVCNGLPTVTAFPQIQTITKSNTTFTITVNNLTAAAASYGSFDCLVGHN